MKMKVKMKSRSYRHDRNRPWSRHGRKYNKYEKSFSIMMLMCIKQCLNNIEAQFMIKLSNTEAEFKKSVAYKKACIMIMRHLFSVS